jgi:NAD(P)-dependent dehydrogenase (short-subunit alcohol dehydrogenase family)
MNGDANSSKPGLLAGKVGLVTGAGTPYGIGRECIKKFAEAGAKAVYACDLNMSSIPSLQEECRNAGYSTIIEGCLLDVSDETQTIAVVKEITKKHGRFDFYIANAGFANYRYGLWSRELRADCLFRSRNLNDTEMIHYDRQVNVMQRGVFLAIKYGSQAMMVISEEKPQFGGTFVVTGSCAGFLGSYSDLPYGEL